MMLEDRKKLYDLLEKWTRAEISYRFGLMGVPEFMQQHADHFDYEDKIRDLMFGSHDLEELGERWGIVEPLPKERRRIIKEDAPKENPKPKGPEHEQRGERGGRDRSHRKPLLERPQRDR